LLSAISVFAQVDSAKVKVAPLVKGSVNHIDGFGFREYIWDYNKNPESITYKGKLPCIVDFYTVWCGPCRRLAPVLEELAKEYEGKVIFYKVNTEDANSVELSRIFNIHSIPTMFYFPLKEYPRISQGALDKETLKNIIDTILLNPQKKESKDSKEQEK